MHDNLNHGEEEFVMTNYFSLKHTPWLHSAFLAVHLSFNEAQPQNDLEQIT